MLALYSCILLSAQGHACSCMIQAALLPVWLMGPCELQGDEALFVMPTQGDSGLNTSLADADSGSRQLHHLSSLSNPAFGPGLQL